MPKVSINILTKNRLEFVKKALASVLAQSFKDFEIVVVNDGSTDGTEEFLISNFKPLNNFKIINHKVSQGISFSRQEALKNSTGEYVAILDDDDEWLDKNKLKKQVEFLDKNPKYVLVGGGIKISNIKYQKSKFRSKSDAKIRRTLLFRNNFFTSTVMFRRQEAIKAGGFIKDGIDFVEDYDLWLRLGLLGKMFNFQDIFAAYRQSVYNKEKKRVFFQKQLCLVKKYSKMYPFSILARVILRLRILF